MIGEIWSNDDNWAVEAKLGVTSKLLFILKSIDDIWSKKNKTKKLIDDNLVSAKKSIGDGRFNRNVKDYANKLTDDCWFNDDGWSK